MSSNLHIFSHGVTGFSVHVTPLFPPNSLESAINILVYKMSNVTTVHTDTSVVVRAYPWANGIALSENKRAFLEAGVQNTTTHPQVLIDMALVGPVAVSYHMLLC